MAEQLIEQKLESLRRCVSRVRERMPTTSETLADDPDSQDIVALNLTRAIQLCGKWTGASSTPSVPSTWMNSGSSLAVSPGPQALPNPSIHPNR